jgi:hypothetical protein
MDPAPRVILLEFNELCPALMERFIVNGLLPNFGRLYDESTVYVTNAEANGEDLNPWVQWVTAHTGLSIEQHGIRHLSEGHHLQTKAIWDLLSDAGFRVWVCGSMNPRCDTPLNGHLLPDPWSTGVRPQPMGAFDTYYDFVAKAVQEHSREHSDRTGAIRSTAFLAYMLSHGISAATIAAVARQLVSERLGETRWKRAVIMDRIQWDLYRHIYRRYQPHFSTFFVNSTAHFQHCYWRHMEPEKFSNRPSDRELRQYEGAIRYGYEKMDAMVGRFLRLAGRETTLIFCTALSQQPYLDFDESGGRQYYRLLKPEALRDKMGLTLEFRYEPIMAEQFFLRFDSRSDAEAAERMLRQLQLDETGPIANVRPQLFNLQIDGDSILCQCRCTGVVSPGAAIIGGELEGPVPFFDVLYRMDAVKSGRHHPDGMFWIRRPSRQHRVCEEKISLRAVAPTILQIFDVPTPEFMTVKGAELDERALTPGLTQHAGVSPCI